MLLTEEQKRKLKEENEEAKSLKVLGVVFNLNHDNNTYYVAQNEFGEYFILTGTKCLKPDYTSLFNKELIFGEDIGD